jgi:hypothetical protein
MSLLYIREILISNFFVEILAFKIKNDLYFVDENIKYIFYTLPFYFIKKICNLFNIEIIYKSDNIYNIHNNYITINLITPIILDIQIITNNNKKINIKDIIKYYNYNIPLNFLLLNSNFDDKKIIYLKYMKRGKIIEININVDEYINQPIINLMN